MALMKPLTLKSVKILHRTIIVLTTNILARGVFQVYNNLGDPAICSEMITWKENDWSKYSNHG